MSKFKKVMPNVRLANTGGSAGFGCEKIVNIDGKDEFVTKSSVDVYPKMPEPETFSLKNQLKSGVNLKEVSVSPVVVDVDRQSEQVSNVLGKATSLSDIFENAKENENDNDENDNDVEF